MSRKDKAPKVSKPFYKRWWFIVIVIFVLIGALGASGGDSDAEDELATNNDTVSSAPSNIEDSDPVNAPVEEEPIIEEVDTYKDGMYKVGSDIQPGLYRALVTGSIGFGYVERSKDSSMSLDSIIANVNLTGDGYVRILDTDAFVKLTGTTLVLYDIDSAEVSFSSEYSDGMYLVGIDIEPGEYKVEVTDTVSKMGYVERLNDVTFEMDSIITNSIVQGQAYVQIESSDFAIRLQGVKMTK